MRHGGLTTVRDFRRHAGLDLLPRLLFRNGDLDTTVFRSILEARLRIGPKVAELAAERHGPELEKALGDSLRALEREEDLLEWQRVALRVLGVRGRRRRFDRVPPDVQRISRRLRASAGSPGRQDDR